MRKRKHLTWPGLFALGALFLAAGASGAGDVPPSRHHLHFGAGVYYPGYYYSRSYQQSFPLAAGEEVLTFRLYPYQHYGRHGALDGAAMTSGGDFAYRYAPGFTPQSPTRRQAAGDTMPPAPQHRHSSEPLSPTP